VSVAISPYSGIAGMFYSVMQYCLLGSVKILRATKHGQLLTIHILTDDITADKKLTFSVNRWINLTQAFYSIYCSFNTASIQGGNSIGFNVHIGGSYRVRILPNEVRLEIARHLVVFDSDRQYRRTVSLPQNLTFSLSVLV